MNGNRQFSNRTPNPNEALVNKRNVIAIASTSNETPTSRRPTGGKENFMEAVYQSSHRVSNDLDSKAFFIAEAFDFEPEHYDSDDDSLSTVMAPSAYDSDDEDEQEGSQTEATRTTNNQDVVP